MLFCCDTNGTTTPNKPNCRWKCTQTERRIFEKSGIHKQTHFYISHWNSKCVPYFVISLFLWDNKSRRSRSCSNLPFISLKILLRAKESKRFRSFDYDVTNGGGQWPFIFVGNYYLLFIGIVIKFTFINEHKIWYCMQWHRKKRICDPIWKNNFVCDSTFISTRNQTTKIDDVFFLCV